MIMILQVLAGIATYSFARAVGNKVQKEKELRAMTARQEYSFVNSNFLNQVLR